MRINSNGTAPKVLGKAQLQASGRATEWRSSALTNSNGRLADSGWIKDKITMVIARCRHHAEGE
jgi:hypothetical protein